MDHESEYIDFKLKHHECRIELLHDILCLSNADNFNHRFIIYGIRNSDSELIGIDPDSKNQSYFIELLRGSGHHQLGVINVALKYHQTILMYCKFVF